MTKDDVLLAIVLVWFVTFCAYAFCPGLLTSPMDKRWWCRWAHRLLGAWSEPDLNSCMQYLYTCRRCGSKWRAIYLGSCPAECDGVHGW